VKDDYRESGTLVMPRPMGLVEKSPPGGEACLVNLHPPGPDLGRRFTLTNSQYTVGRDTDSTFVVGRGSVSRQHARLYLEDDMWWVEDLGSTNGTFLGRERVTAPTPLEPGRPLKVGKTVLELRK
jgi:pSer/pThr/pTyr-binding forkhead associated (FHA) protein